MSNHSIDEFNLYLEDVVNRFYKHWKAMNEISPDNWPLEYSNRAEWLDQFMEFIHNIEDSDMDDQEEDFS